MSKNFVEKAQDETTMEFYQYLIDIETLTEDMLKQQMNKKGLIFLWSALGIIGIMLFGYFCSILWTKIVSIFMYTYQFYI